MIRYLVVGVAAAGLAAFGMSARAEDVHVTVSDPATTHVKVEGENAYNPAGKPMFFVMGGADSSTQDFDNNTGLDMGYIFGGGLGIQMSRAVTLRASYTYGNAQADPNALVLGTLANTDFERHYYGADLQFRAANNSGFMPYLFLGGGAVTISPDTNTVISSPNGVIFSNESFTKPAGRGGLGFEYQLPNSGFGLYAEGAGWVYDFDHYGFNKTQWDINWGGGLTYRFGY